MKARLLLIRNGMEMTLECSKWIDCVSGSDLYANLIVIVDLLTEELDILCGHV